MHLRIGTEDLKVPHHLSHYSPLPPFLFAHISPQYLYVFALRPTVFLCQWYYVYFT